MFKFSYIVINKLLFTLKLEKKTINNNFPFIYLVTYQIIIIVK